MKYLVSVLVAVALTVGPSQAAETMSVDDAAMIRARIKNKQCPTTAPKYATETYAKKCGPAPGPKGSFNDSKKWGACSKGVDQNNELLRKYKDFIEKSCKGLH